MSYNGNRLHRGMLMCRTVAVFAVNGDLCPEPFQHRKVALKRGMTIRDFGS